MNKTTNHSETSQPQSNMSANNSDTSPMSTHRAEIVLEEMQLWRRDLPPYNDVTPDKYLSMPYSPQEFGQAIDIAITCLQRINDLKISCSMILNDL